MKEGKMTRSEAGRLGAMASKAGNKARGRRIRDRYEASPKICPECEGAIPYEKRSNKYCGHSCSATAGNRGVRRHGGPPRECLGCGGETRNHKFCSLRCQHDHGWSEKKAEIEKTGVYPASNRIIRRFLVERDGVCCSVCGGEEWMGQPMPLEVDHISGDSGDNRIENLRMVCGNCGMQLPTYKGRNMGKGRWERRKRYAEGKSY